MRPLGVPNNSSELPGCLLEQPLKGLSNIGASLQDAEGNAGPTASNSSPTPGAFLHRFGKWSVGLRVGVKRSSGKKGSGGKDPKRRAFRPLNWGGGLFFFSRKITLCTATQSVLRFFSVRSEMPMPSKKPLWALNPFCVVACRQISNTPLCVGVCITSWNQAYSVLSNG